MSYAFFYKSVNGDRVYDDTSFEHWLKKFFTSGVFLNDLQVTANNDMTVTVGAGYVNADGKVKVFESESSLIIETAGASYPRIDSIVLERNDTERDIILKVVKGGYSSQPVAHTPVRQNGVYQLVIAQVLVNAGAVKVTQADITDTRSNTELCGIVAAAVDQIDFSQVQAQFDSYFAQYKAQVAMAYMQYNEDMETYLDQMATDFAAWFEEIRNQLDEDAAGHLQNQIDEINEKLEYAGGSNVNVNVIAGEYNIEGLEVNLMIDGKTYTSIVNSEKVAEFTGILEVGTAKITCVDEVQEFRAETSIDIPYYGAYEATIKLISSGSYKEWLEAGGLNPSSYESLDALLEDEKAVRTLMTKKESVDVLAQMRGDNLTTIINNPYAAKWVNYREYAYSTLYAVSEIKTLMDASKMYGMYITVESDGTWQPKGLVPVMTSNTAPYGEAIASSENSNNVAYCAFNNVNDAWVTGTGVAVAGSWLSYKFFVPANVKRFKLTNRLSGGDVKSVKNFKLQATNGKDAWVDLGVYTNESDKQGFEAYYDVINDTYYMQYRVYVDSGYSTENVTIGELQFYGRQLESLVPPMTSNTAPIGEVIFDSEYSTDYQGYMVFDDSSTTRWNAEYLKANNAYVGYKFNTPTVVKMVYLDFVYKSGTYGKNYIIQASNDNKKWDDLYSGITETKTASDFSHLEYIVSFDNNTPYLYYRCFIKDSHNNGVSLWAMQFYGTPDYESRNYIYDNGVNLGCESMNANNGWLHTNVSYDEPTYNSDSVKLESSSDLVNDTHYFSGIVSKSAIDLSKYNVICARTDGIVYRSDTSCSIVVLNNKTGRYSYDATVKQGYSPVTYLDITNISNTEYVAVMSPNKRSALVYALWIE